MCIRDRLKSERCIIPRHSGVSAIGMDIFEVFIEMFIDEVISITKRGLKGGYIPIEENSSFYRGKIKFTQQIKFNCVHKAVSYTHLDVYKRQTMNTAFEKLLDDMF